jgi:hypothetical protein
MNEINEYATAGSPAVDTLVGAAEIALFLGKTVRQANYMLETRQIPAFKLGGRWHMRRSTYGAFVERLESQMAPTVPPGGVS